MSLSRGKCLLGSRSNTSSNCCVILTIGDLASFQLVVVNAGDNAMDVYNAIPDVALNIRDDGVPICRVLTSARSGCVRIYHEFSL